MKKKIFSCIFIVLALVFVYAPILLLTFYSFTDTQLIGKWDGFSLNLYAKLFTNEELRTMIINTVVLALLSSLISTVLGTCGAIGIHYSKNKFGKTVKAVSNINIINAEIVIAVSLALVFSIVALNKTYFSLLMGHVVLQTPFVVLSVMPKLKSMDSNLYEAALDLGATPSKALFKVVLPEIMSGIISGFALALTLSLDDCIITLFTKPATFDTISTYAYNSVKNQAHSKLPALRALSAIIFVIILVVALVINFRKSKKKEAE